MANTRLGYMMVKKESTLATAVKPTHPIRFKDGDIMANKEIIPNDPIQNNRWKALNSVSGKEDTSGGYNLDLDANECIHWIAAAMGTLVSTDISSATDTTVYSHVCTAANALYGLTVEQGKGNLTDTANNRQNYQVDRAYGVMVDEFTISAKDGIVNLAVKLKAHGVFQKSDLTADAAAGASVVVNIESAEGLVATDDTVNIFDETPQNETDAIAALSVANKTITIATLGNSYTIANKAKVELVPQTPSYSTAAKVFSFIHASFKFGDDLTAAASASEENVEDWSFTYKNNLEERYGSLRPSPSKIGEKGNQAYIKYTKYFENVDDRDRYLRNIQKGCIITLETSEIVSATDTNNRKYGLKIELADIRMTSYEMNTGTDEIYAVSVEGECFYDTSDGFAVRITGYNSKAGTEYTA